MPIIVLEPERSVSEPTMTPVELAPSCLDPKGHRSNRDHAHHADPKPSCTRPQCLWCGRAFTSRITGGSPQRFCSTGHRQAFWVAARRWTMRAVEAGLLNVDCLRCPRTSVHAVWRVLGRDGHHRRGERANAAHCRP